MWLLSNWKLVLIGVLSLCLGGGAIFHKIDVARVESEAARQIAAQKEDDSTACANAQQITKEVSDGLQSKIAALNARVNQLKRVRPSQCVAVLAAGPFGHDAAAGNPGHAGEDGVNAAALLDYAAECEHYALQLDSCQDFVRKSK